MRFLDLKGRLDHGESTGCYCAGDAFGPKVDPNGSNSFIQHANATVTRQRKTALAIAPNVIRGNSGARTRTGDLGIMKPFKRRRPCTGGVQVASKGHSETCKPVTPGIQAVYVWLNCARRCARLQRIHTPCYRATLLPRYIDSLRDTVLQNHNHVVLYRRI